MKLFIASLVFFILTGCGHNQTIPQERIVYHTVLVTPPDELLQDCELQPPPDVEKYKSAEWTDKEDMLVIAYKGALSKTILCNVNKKSLREWKQKQEQTYSTKDKPLDK